MSRNITSVVAAEAAKQQIRTAHLFRAVFTNSSTGGDETYYLTDNFRDVEWQGETYSALGHLLSFEGVEESTDLQIASVRTTLSGVDSNLISAVLQYQYMDRALEIWRVFFTAEESAQFWDDAGVWDDTESMVLAADTLINDPVKIFDGTMDAPTIADDPEAGTMTVQLTASSHFADFGRRPGRHTNHQEQQAHFKGDRFFEWVGQMDKDIIWGRTG